jgi:hypothetical protein
MHALYAAELQTKIKVVIFVAPADIILVESANHCRRSPGKRLAKRDKAMWVRRRVIFPSGFVPFLI